MSQPLSKVDPHNTWGLMQLESGPSVQWTYAHSFRSHKLELMLGRTTMSSAGSQTSSAHRRLCLSDAHADGQYIQEWFTLSQSKEAPTID